MLLLTRTQFPPFCFIGLFNVVPYFPFFVFFNTGVAFSQLYHSVSKLNANFKHIKLENKGFTLADI